MYCFQCQETKHNSECTSQGFCGKQASTAHLQDVLIFTAQGLATACGLAAEASDLHHHFVQKALFTTVTNVNFDDTALINLIHEGLQLRDEVKTENHLFGDLPDCVLWHPRCTEDIFTQAEKIGVLHEPDEDIRSLKELLIYGLKGVAAYAEHAAVLEHQSPALNENILKLLALSYSSRNKEDLLDGVMQCGNAAIDVLALLDSANTRHYGSPEVTEVALGTASRPGILISGHDLKDLEMLLEQTQNCGVDVYTHGEMLPAHYYPKFKTYPHLKGNYGGAWWQQKKEFAKFNGPIIMTTNCLMPPRDEYKTKVFTTGNVAFPGLKHIPSINGLKDFSEVIDLARQCAPPTQLEDGTLVGGFAHSQVLALADQVVEAVKQGAISRFVVMAGCDGAHKTRQYFTDVAESLPKDTIILTAGCAKYRYNKLNLGDISGIPRVLDAGQCNDSYSLVVIAQALQKAFKLDDINDLPISFDIAWYEQKAVAVLLALLALGVKDIRLGPTLPAFLSPAVSKTLTAAFGLKGVQSAEDDVIKIMAGG